MRVKGDRKTNWEEAIYVSKDSLIELLKRYQIPGNKQVPIRTDIGDKFLKELKAKAMDLKKSGGRFVSLIEEADSYTLFYSNDITDIKNEDIGEGSGDEIKIDA